MGLSERLKKLERQAVPPVDIVALILRARGKPRAPTQTAAELRRIIPRSCTWGLERRIAKARLRVGLYAPAAPQ